MRNQLVRERNHPRNPYAPSRPPSGTDNFANLLRDPALVIGDVIHRELVDRGHHDVRPALLAVAAHIARDGSRITELGYAERVPDPADGRAKLVRPTERAVAVQAEARAIIADLREAWAAAMEPGELDQLEALLRRLRSVLWP